MNNENQEVKKRGVGRPSKFKEPYKLNLTIERNDYEEAKLLFGKEINSVFNEVFRKVLKKRRLFEEKNDQKEK